ncbi:MAG: hypothetical protein RLZ98_2648 [Pseudomonadota bacterium]|jgi:acyl-CoA reductase-like NAD-dependent aldehyde dehydrogenase
MLIMQEESFGPVVPAVTCRSLDEVIGFISGRDKQKATG